MTKLKVVLPFLGACILGLSQVPQLAPYAGIIGSIGTFLIGLGTKRPGDVLAAPVKS